MPKVRQIPETRDPVPVSVAKTSLALYMLLGPNAMSRRIVFPPDGSGPGMEDFRAFVGSCSFILDSVTDTMERTAANAMGMEKAVKGKGRVESVLDTGDDDELPQRTMTDLAMGIEPVPEQTARLRLVADRCRSILDGCNGDISVKDADFLIRGTRELLEANLYESWSGRDSGAAVRRTEAQRKSSLNMIRMLASEIKADPYVRLRSMVSTLYGSGAVMELDGIKSNTMADFSPIARNNTDSKRNVRDLLVSVGGFPASLRIQNWSPEFESELAGIIAEISGNGTDGKPDGRYTVHVPGYEEASRTVSAYRKLSFERKSIAGLGRILDRKEYTDGPDSPFGMILELMESAKELHTGTQAIQSLLLTGSRALAGINERKSLDSLGGGSWFDLSGTTGSNATPFRLRGLVGLNLPDLMATWFALETEKMKLEAIPVEFLDRNGETASAILKEREECSAAAEALRNTISDVFKADLVSEIRETVEKQDVDIRSFHNLTGPADMKSSDEPWLVAAKAVKQIVEELYTGNRNRTFSEARVRELNEHLRRKLQELDTADGKRMLIRFSEMCGFRIRNYPLSGGKRMEPSSPVEAYSFITSEVLDKMNVGDTKDLDVLLELLRGYKPWDDFYRETVDMQVERRRQFETDRAMQWLDVCRKAFRDFNEPSLETESGMLSYRDATMHLAQQINVMFLSLFTDSVLKSGNLRQRPKAEIGPEEFRSIMDPFARIAEGNTIELDPEEKTVAAFVSDPFARNALEKARKRMQRNLNKMKFDRRDETPDSTRGLGMEVVDSGPLMDFGEDILASDGRFSALMDSYGLFVTSKGMKDTEAGKALGDYAKEKMLNVLSPVLGKPCDPGDFAIADNRCALDATEQRDLVSLALEEYMDFLSAKDASHDAVASVHMEKTLGYLEDARENNPGLKIFGYSNPVAEQVEMDFGAIENAVRTADPQTPRLLRALRWADVTAQFNDSYGDNPSEKAMLSLSRRSLDSQRNKALLAVSEYESSVRGDRNTALKIGAGIARVFSPEIRTLSGLKSETPAEVERIGSMVALAENAVEKAGLYDFLNRAIGLLCRKAASELVRKDARTQVNFDVQDQSGFSLYGKTSPGERNAFKGSVQGEEKRMTSLPSDWKAILSELTKGDRDFEERETTVTRQKEIFSRVKPPEEKGTLRKLESRKDAGAVAYRRAMELMDRIGWGLGR